MKIYVKLAAIALAAFSISSACKKEKEEATFTVNATHSDYKSFEATNVSIQSITVDGTGTPWNFDLYSNISVGETRTISVTSEIENDKFPVEITSSGSGSGIQKKVTISGVESGDIIDLDLGTNDYTIR